MKTLEQIAKDIRKDCIRMSYNAKEGHLGSALSCVDILVALFEHFRFDGEDKLFFSKGHGCSALYATYAEYGFIDKAELETYAQPNSRLLPHPDKLALPILEMSAGSLGHGLGYACGVAYSMKQKGQNGKVVVVMGDGECNEGSVWEAAQFAKAHGLDNLLVVVDYNGVQSIGKTDEISGDTSLVDKFKAFGWAGTWCIGSSQFSLDTTMQFAKKGLTAIVATTTPGISHMNKDWYSCLWHYRVPNKEEVEIMLEELDA